MERALLGAICDVYPDAITKGEVLKRTDYASSGPVSTAFAKLVAYGYVLKNGPFRVVASDDLFDA